MAPIASQMLWLTVWWLASLLASSPWSPEADFYNTKRQRQLTINAPLRQVECKSLITCPCQVRFCEVILYFHLPVYDSSISRQRLPPAPNNFRLYPDCTSYMRRLVAVKRHRKLFANRLKEIRKKRTTSETRCQMVLNFWLLKNRVYRSYLQSTVLHLYLQYIWILWSTFASLMCYLFHNQKAD